MIFTLILLALKILGQFAWSVNELTCNTALGLGYLAEDGWLSAVVAAVGTWVLICGVERRNGSFVAAGSFVFLVIAIDVLTTILTWTLRGVGIPGIFLAHCRYGTNGALYFILLEACGEMHLKKVRAIPLLILIPAVLVLPHYTLLFATTLAFYAVFPLKSITVHLGEIAASYVDDYFAPRFPSGWYIKFGQARDTHTEESTSLLHGHYDMSYSHI